MRLGILALVFLGVLAIDGCDSDVECEVTLTCPCETTEQCERAIGERVEECESATCLEEGYCGTAPLAVGTPCSLGACDGNGTCVPNHAQGGGGTGGMGDGGAGGGGGTGGGGAPPLPEVILSAGNFHTCAKLIDDSLICWGSDGCGQLGDGDTPSNGCTGGSSNTPVVVEGIPTALSVSGGFAHTCAPRSDKTARCWGNNQHGELGDGSMTQSPSVVPVAVSGIIAMSTGREFTCAANDAGLVKCWGRNDVGQLGDGMMYPNSPTPVGVSGVDSVVALSSGSFHTCALQSSGTVRCWGAGTNGQLGDGTFTSSPVPVQVVGLSDAISISSGQAHSCAVRQGGSVVCWGFNLEGAVGDGTKENREAPTPVQGLADMIQVDAGWHSTCAVKNDGTAWCWGFNDLGALGDGTYTESIVPAQVVDTGFKSITVGEHHACGVMSDDSIKCWGAGDSGQLGNGTNTAMTHTPVVVQLP